MKVPVHTRILSAGSIDASKLTYVVIGATEDDQWLFVRHRERTSWEMPAGHIEQGESAHQAAVRELYEETGTVNSSMEHLCDYEVTVGDKTEFGRLYRAYVHEREAIPEHEIDEIMLVQELPDHLTYPEVQTLLFRHVKEQLRS